MTLRARLVVALSGILTALLLAGVLIPRAVRAAQIDQVDRQLELLAPAATRFADPTFQAATINPGGQLGAFSEAYVAVLNDDGTHDVVAYAQEFDDEREPTDMPAATSTPGRWEITTSGSTTGSTEWRVVVISGPQGSTTRAIVAIPLDRVEETVWRLQLVLLVAGGGIALALVLAGWWVWRLGLRPIGEVTDVADAIASGERDRRVAVRSTGTEAAHLATAFNVMLDEREAAEERLRRFVSDASHELRTPVTAIRGFTDLYRQGALDGDAVTDAIRRIGQEATRMGSLVEDMLLLARLDEGRPLERSVVDVSSLLADAAFDASATHPSRRVHSLAADGVQVVGDESRLRQVISNLVVNALVHTTGDISLNAHTSGDICVVEVRDTGQGMDAEAAAKVFDRFWRGDTSRVRNSGGAGLGLSIVQSIVAAHGGRVAVDSTPGVGTTFRVVLPVGDLQQTRNS